MRKSLILPVAFGTIFAALSAAQARPLQPVTVVTGQTEAQARAIVAEAREAYPNAEVQVTYDWGRRSFTVEMKPHDGNSGIGGGEGVGAE